MPDDDPGKSPTGENSTSDAVADAKRVINMLASRVYDTQCRLGLWNRNLDEILGEMQDLSPFFADLHLKVSGAYELWSRDVVPDEEDEPHMAAETAVETEEEMSLLLVDIVQSCFGLLRKQGRDVGSLLLDTVIAQAVAAAEAEGSEKAEADMLANGELRDHGLREELPDGRE
jgi:hypothetical protein